MRRGRARFWTAVNVFFAVTAYHVHVFWCGSAAMAVYCALAAVSSREEPK